MARRIPVETSRVSALAFLSMRASCMMRRNRDSERVGLSCAGQRTRAGSTGIHGSFLTKASPHDECARGLLRYMKTTILLCVATFGASSLAGLAQDSERRGPPLSSEQPGRRNPPPDNRRQRPHRAGRPQQKYSIEQAVSCTPIRSRAKVAAGRLAGLEAIPGCEYS
jgi:hypothetical protein